MKRDVLTAAALLVVAMLLCVGCETTSAQEDAVIGGMLGAGTGAVIGHQSGHQGEGAVVGALAGALAGALLGDQVDRQPAATPARATATTQRVQTGHYETRIVKSPNGETYEERVWVPDR